MGKGRALVRIFDLREPFGAALRTLRREGDAAADRARAAEATTYKELRRLSRHARWDVRRAVTQNPACPPELMRGLFTDHVWAVRAAVAAAPHATEPVLLWCTQLGEAVRPVRLALAGNPSASRRVITNLMTRPDQFVRGKAIGHPAAPPDLLKRYARGMNRPAWVLRGIATNPACPEELAEEILAWLALGGVDGDPTFDPDDCSSHPGDPDLPSWVWYRQRAATMSEPHLHPLWRVRQQVTTTRHEIPYAWLHSLARDPRDEVRLTVTGFAGMHRRILQELAQDADPTIAERAAETLKRKPAFDRERYGRLRLKSPTLRRSILAGAVATWLFAGVISGIRDDDRRSDPASSDYGSIENLFHPPTTLSTVSEIESVAGSRALPGGGELRSGHLATRAGETAVEIAAGNHALVVTSVTGQVGDLAELGWTVGGATVVEPGSILRFESGPIQPTTIEVRCHVGGQPDETVVLSIEGTVL